MLWRSILCDLYDQQKFGLRPWLAIYSLAIAMPFAFIFFFSFTHSGQNFPILLDLILVAIGFYGLFTTIVAIAQLCWNTVKAPELTGEVLLRLLLTYFYMLVSFAGFYLVIYLGSDYGLAQAEMAYSAGGPAPAVAGEKLALAGVELRLWSASPPNSGTAFPQFQLSNLPLIYLDMLYFSMTTLTTLGFGDIVAKAPLIKLLVMFEAVFGNLLLVLGVASIVPRRDSGS